jgi:hypothetical protein
MSGVCAFGCLERCSILLTFQAFSLGKSMKWSVLNGSSSPHDVPSLGRRKMMRLQFVRNYHFIFENNDGSGREELGQIELPDDDEAFALSRS